MNSMNYARGSRAWNRYWFKRTRVFIGLRLIGLGQRMGDWAEWIAPWRFAKPEPQQPMPRIRYGDWE